MRLNVLKHAAERISHVTCRAGHPASVHGHGPRSMQSRRQAQIWLVRLTLQSGADPFPLPEGCRLQPPLASSHAASHHMPCASQYSAHVSWGLTVLTCASHMVASLLRHSASHPSISSHSEGPPRRTPPARRVICGSTRLASAAFTSVSSQVSTLATEASACWSRSPPAARAARIASPPSGSCAVLKPRHQNSRRTASMSAACPGLASLVATSEANCHAPRRASW
mmetsp:Transcript_21042/g.53499  ORF Transcript_21042/g.53499 Transcript_21042/m.53499 type:complete len:225 (+) Transcript_21042:366-1040(+)